MTTTAPATPRGFLRGLRYALGGLPFVLQRPGLLGLATLPVLINLALLVGLFTVGLRYHDDALALAFPWARPEGWLVALWWLGLVLVRALLYLAQLVVTLMLVVVLGSILAAPFHDALSERAERIVRGRSADSPLSLAGMLRDIGAATVDQIALLLLYLAGLCAILLLHLVPLAGTVVSSALSFVWTCWFFALEFTDGALTRAGHRWDQRWRFLLARPRLSLGFGVGAWVLLLVPLTLPFLVVSGTLMVCDLLAAEAAPSPAPPATSA